jgi:hypothetical protein
MRLELIFTSLPLRAALPFDRSVCHPAGITHVAGRGPVARLSGDPVTCQGVKEQEKYLLYGIILLLKIIYVKYKKPFYAKNIV